MMHTHIHTHICIQAGVQKTLYIISCRWSACENVEGPCELIRRDEILKALRMMKKGKAAGPRGIVSERFIGVYTYDWTISKTVPSRVQVL